MRTLVRILPLLAIAVLAVTVAPDAALTFAPALLILGLLSRGVRPGERTLVRLIARRRGRLRAPRRTATPRLALVVRRTGRLIAAALAVRPPPAAALTQ